MDALWAWNLAYENSSRLTYQINTKHTILCICTSRLTYQQAIRNLAYENSKIQSDSTFKRIQGTQIYHARGHGNIVRFRVIPIQILRIKIPVRKQLQSRSDTSSPDQT